jgi:hypothetical protein
MTWKGKMHESCQRYAMNSACLSSNCSVDYLEALVEVHDDFSF